MYVDKMVIMYYISLTYSNQSPVVKVFNKLNFQEKFVFINKNKLQLTISFMVIIWCFKFICTSF